MHLARIRGRFQPLLDVIPAISMVGVLAYGGILVVDHRIQVGQLVEFNLFITMLINPLRSIGQIIAQAQRAVASSERVGQILDAAARGRRPPARQALPPGPGEVRFDAVQFAYGNRRHAVLDRLDLTVAAGESVALVGSTGSGKTTVARLIPRFYDVDGGRVLLDGHDVRDLKLYDLRKAVAVVFEDTFLFTDTVAANIAFAEPGASTSSGSSGPPSSPAPTSSSPSCPTATTRSSASEGSRCRAASASGSPWPGPSSPTPGS